MNEPHDPNRTVDVPSVPADSLEAGLAAGFGKPAEAPRSSLDAAQGPVLLREADGESDHVVKTHSDAMPPKSETGDRCQLYGEIPRGGMGAVLRGRDVDLGRDLAVKAFSPQSLGVCQPTLAHNCRAVTNDARFKLSANTVARPVGVRPRIRSPSGAQRKCSAHTW